MSYDKLTTYLESKSIDIRDVEDDFRLVYENEVYRIESWNTDKLGEKPSMDTINALAASPLPKVRGDRRAAYPELAEQLDMLFRDIAANKVTADGELYKALAKVKSDNPKGGD
tara:strand:- start:2249 stop:2587 length:339 start_codon:yes stop_codon:yes gene_type:complete